MLGAKVGPVAINDDNVIDRLKGGQTSGYAQASLMDLQTAFMVDTVIVQESLESMGSFFNDSDIFYGYVAPTLGMNTPTSIAMPYWTPFKDGQDLALRRYEMVETENRVIEAKVSFSAHVVSSRTGAGDEGGRLGHAGTRRIAGSPDGAVRLRQERALVGHPFPGRSSGSASRSGAELVAPRLDGTRSRRCELGRCSESRTPRASRKALACTPSSTSRQSPSASAREGESAQPLPRSPMTPRQATEAVESALEAINPKIRFGGRRNNQSDAEWVSVAITPISDPYSDSTWNEQQVLIAVTAYSRRDNPERALHLSGLVLAQMPKRIGDIRVVERAESETDDVDEDLSASVVEFTAIYPKG